MQAIPPALLQRTLGDVGRGILEVAKDGGFGSVTIEIAEGRLRLVQVAKSKLVREEQATGLMPMRLHAQDR